MSRRISDRLPDLIRACELRRKKCQEMRQQKHFAWASAQKALKAHNKSIKKPEHLRKVKGLKGERLIGELQEILIALNLGINKIVPDAPARRELSAAAKRPLPQGYRPGVRSGAEAILRALLQLAPNEWHEFAVVQREAQPYSETSMTIPSGYQGRTAWTGNKTLVLHGLVEKNEVVVAGSGWYVEWYVEW